jgi:hypothetical protein
LFTRKKCDIQHTVHNLSLRNAYLSLYVTLLMYV